MLTGLAAAPNDMPQNIVTTNDPKVHRKMKSALNNSFTADAVREQRPVIEGAADLLFQRFKDIAAGPGEINMTDWVNFFTIDIIGDLAFGESFGCMQSSDYHPWVRTLFNFLKGMVFASATRFYPPLDKVILSLLPKAMMDAQKEHTAFANAKSKSHSSSDWSFFELTWV